MSNNQEKSTSKSQNIAITDEVRGKVKDPSEGEVIEDETQVKNERQKIRPEGVAIVDEVQGRTEQRTEPYLKYGEGAAAGSNAVIRDKSTPKVIFFGNGPLAENALNILQPHTNIIFHARTAADLPEVIKLKHEHPEAYGVLASFGVLIKSDILELFEPEGILNLHPSLLPKYRGPSPIESAILAGDTEFSYSIMKLVKKMDAGPIYHQATLPNLPLDKSTIYQSLATSGATWLTEHLSEIRTLTPTPQDDSTATYTEKLTKEMSLLQPEKYSAAEIFRQIIAYQGFPKPKYTFYRKTCIILQAHLVDATMIVCDPSIIDSVASPLMIKCADRNFVAIDQLQPEGKKPMDAKAFINGYGKKR